MLKVLHLKPRFTERILTIDEQFLHYFLFKIDNWYDVMQPFLIKTLLIACVFFFFRIAMEDGCDTNFIDSLRQEVGVGGASILVLI